MSQYRSRWRCPECLAVNDPAETSCERCGFALPPGGEPDA